VSSSSPNRSHIAGALRLRRWALRVFSSLFEPPPRCSATSWGLFLLAERCALPLKNCLTKNSHWQELPPEALKTLDAAATRDLQGVLSARAGLAGIAKIADELALEVVVLKGGVAALNDAHALALADIDVLARQPDAEKLVAALDRAGYTDYGGGSERHLEPRFAPEVLAIETHTTLAPADRQWADSVWSRVVPLDELAVLHRLAPRDHLWHLLLHVVVQHPFRAGAIRDLLLIADAFAECSEQDLAELDITVDRHWASEAFQAILGLARQLHSREAPEDLFRRQAATAYFLHRYGVRVPGPPILREDVGASVSAMLHGPAAYRRWYRQVIWQDTPGRSLSPPIAWLEARSPRGGRTARVLSRMIRVAAAAPPAMALAATAAMRFKGWERDASDYGRTESSSVRSPGPRPYVSSPKESE